MVSVFYGSGKKISPKTRADLQRRINRHGYHSLIATKYLSRNLYPCANPFLFLFLFPPPHMMTERLGGKVIASLALPGYSVLDD